MTTKPAAIAQSGKTYSDYDLTDYIICPALSFINDNNSELPPRAIVKRRLRKGINEIALFLLDGNEPDDITDIIHRVVNNIFSDLEYNRKEVDALGIIQTYTNFVHLIFSKELEIEELSKSFTIQYDYINIESQIDLVAVNPKTGKRELIIVDFSNTKYEPRYNPIIYRCQLVYDYMNLFSTNTEIKVLSLGKGSIWNFKYNMYHDLLNLSIKETLQSMKAGVYPVRVGWWCAGCVWRGICHTVYENNIK